MTASPEALPPGRGRRPAAGVIFIVFGFWAIWLLHSIANDIRRQRLIAEYQGSQWFVSYSHGFVRRGLPGELLDIVWAPSAYSVRVVGWGITIASLIAAVLLAWAVARRHAAGASQAVPLALILICPLALGSLFRNEDRYDAIGVVLVWLAVVVLKRRRITAGPALAVVAVLAAVAVACEEFLLLFLAPFVVVATYRFLTRRRIGGSRPVTLGRLTCTAAVCLSPALIVVLLSAIRRPSMAYVAAVVRASGHPKGDLTAASALRLSILDQIRFSYDFSGGARYTAFTIAIWLLVYAVSVVAIAALVRGAGEWYWVSATWCAAAAIGLNLIFVDARRWWALAFVTHLALTSVDLPPRGSRRRPIRWELAARELWPATVVPASVVVSVLALLLPLTTIHPGFFTHRPYWSSLADAWIPGPNNTYATWIRRAL